MLLANRGFNSLFDDMFDDPFFTRSYSGTSSQVMKTDIHENQRSFSAKNVSVIFSSI